MEINSLSSDPAIDFSGWIVQSRLTLIGEPYRAIEGDLKVVQPKECLRISMPKHRDGFPDSGGYFDDSVLVIRNEQSSILLNF